MTAPTGPSLCHRPPLGGFLKPRPLGVVFTPACGHCGCRVIGHGKEERGTIYCCEKCAEHGAVVKAHHPE